MRFYPTYFLNKLDPLEILVKLQKNKFVMWLLGGLFRRLISLMQDKLIFLTNQVGERTIRKKYQKYAEDVSFTTNICGKDIKLAGLWMRALNSSGAIRENVPVVIPFLGQIQRQEEFQFYMPSDLIGKVHIVAINYPGYAESEGTPSEASLFAMAERTYDWVKENIPHSRVYVMGYSLGTGVAAYLSSRRKIDGLTLVTPYSSMLDVVHHNFSSLERSVLEQHLRHKFDSVTYLTDETNHTPCYIIRAEKDAVIPRELTRVLSKELRIKGTRFGNVVIPHASHMFETSSQKDLLADQIGISIKTFNVIYRGEKEPE